MISLDTLTCMIKQFATVFAAHLNLQWEVAEQLDYLCHVVVIFSEKFSLPLWVKEIFGRQ